MELTEVEQLQQRIMMLEIENSNLKHTLSRLQQHFNDMAAGYLRVAVKLDSLERDA